LFEIYKVVLTIRFYKVRLAQGLDMGLSIFP